MSGDTRFCGACGQANSINARFCSRCGAALAPLATPASAPVSPAAPAAPAAAPAPGPAPRSVGISNKTMAAASIDPAELAAHVAAIQAAQAKAAQQAPPSAPAAPAHAPAAQAYAAPAPAAPASVAYASPATAPAAAVADSPASAAAALAPVPPAVFSPPAAAAARPAPAADGMPASRPRVHYATIIDPPRDPGSFEADAGPNIPDASAEASPAPPAPAAEGVPMRTMLGMSAPAVVPPNANAPQSASAERPRDQIMKSILGGGAAPAPVATTAAPAAAAAASDAVVTENEVAKAPRAPMKTMLGMAFTGLPAAGAAPPSPAVEPQPPSPAAAPAHDVVNAVGPTLAASVPLAPTPAVADPAPAPRKPLGPSHRTMLGVVAPPGAIAAAQAAAAARPPSDAPAAIAPPMATPTSSAPMITGEMSLAGLPSPRRRTNALLAVVLVLGALLVVGGGVGLVYLGLFGGGARALTVSAAHGPSGELLRVEVPGVPEGYRARFAGVEVPLAAGRAEFPLAADSLHVGDNPLSIDLLSPSGQVETHSVTLTLTYRVRADLGALSGTPPAIVVVVEAVPGSNVVVDGEALTLDGTGRATRSYPLDGMTPTAEGLVEHVAHYTVTPPAASGGAPAQGTLTTRVPLTTLHLDRPGDDAVTDRAEVEIAGAVLSGATLTIDGAPVTVLPEGRFLHRYPMPAPGDFTPRVVAVAPGRAPAVRTLHIRRVADLAREAATFTYDRTLTYTRLATAPTTFASQRVMYEGRVYNVDVHDGRGVLQMLVRDCPTGQRCPLWVSYAAAVDVTVESWVRIYGTVEGEQQFRSTTGEVRTVPSVNATFVLPARP